VRHPLSRRFRILIILLADQGKTLAATAQSLSCCEQTVLNQRQRFLARRAEGAVEALQDLPRSGRPGVYTAQQRALITATVCETLKQQDLPLSRLSTADLLRVIHRQDGLASVSQSTLTRQLQQDALKPWQYRYFSSITTSCASFGLISSRASNHDIVRYFA
jgi:hypothetical protein